jgi:hypothetical protein
VKQEIGSTYFYDNFISSEEQEIIREWALRNEKHLIPGPEGPNRARQLFKKIPENLNILGDIKTRIIESENLHEIATDSVRGDYLSIQRNHAVVPPHRDITIQPGNEVSYYMRRYNIFISLPEIGGLPIYEGKTLDITERSMLKVDAGLVIHGTTQISGELPRIMLSYGFSIYQNNLK